MRLLALPPVMELGPVRATPRRRVAAIEAIDAEFVMVDATRRQLAAPRPLAHGDRRALAAYAEPVEPSRLLAIA